MRVTLAEIYWGHILVGLGSLQIGAYKGHMQLYLMPLWAAYVLLAGGAALPLLAWYIRSPFQEIEIKKP